MILVNKKLINIVPPVFDIPLYELWTTLSVSTDRVFSVYPSGLIGFIVFICLIKNVVFISNIVNYYNVY